MTSIREVQGGLIHQGADEAWRYAIDTAPYSGVATGTPTLVVYDEKDLSVVTATVVSGACSLAGTIVTTGIIQLLAIDHTYFCLVNWSVGGSQSRSCFFRIRGER